jgi:hypothetical protein
MVKAKKIKCEDKPIIEIDELTGLTNSAVYIKRAIAQLRASIDIESYLDQFDELYPTDFDDPEA